SREFGERRVGDLAVRPARLAWDRVEPPQLAAARRVVSGDIASSAELGAPVADDRPALHDPGRPGDGAVGGRVGGLHGPDLATGARVYGDQPSVDRAHIDAPIPIGGASVDHVATGLPPRAGNLGVEL